MSPYSFLILGCVVIYSIYAAWEFTRHPDGTDIIGKRCFQFWSLAWLPSPTRKD